MAATVNTPVPHSRVAWLKRTSAGLVSDAQIVLQSDEVALIAFDFTNDLAIGQRLASLTTVALESGAGVTFSDVGVNGTRALTEATAVTAGTYVAQATVVYSDGGTVVLGDCTIVVTS